MGRIAALGLLALTVTLLGLHSADGRVGDDDTVVIDALADGQIVPLSPSRRGARQLVGSRGLCLTSKGLVGKCTLFKECFPYFKIPDLSPLEGWVLGIFDTCSYTQPNGKLSFGICCVDPPQLPPPGILPDSQSNEVQQQQLQEQEQQQQQLENIQSTVAPQPIVEDVDPQYDKGGRLPEGGWPPPLPTHPPYHTIPALPTHPTTTSAVPSTTTTRSTSKRPGFTPGRPGGTTWPTKRPGLVPTTSATTISTSRPGSASTIGPPANFGAGCGAKNFEQSSRSFTYRSRNRGSKNSEEDNGSLDDWRIVGGHPTRPGEWPWIAGLFNAGRHICGGSLIDDRHILTAAHCVAQMSSWDVARLTVRLGDHDIRTPLETKHIERRVLRVVRHRGFDIRTLYNDVAILTLNEPVEFSEYIRPVCLPSGSSLYSGKTATVIGWGSLRENGPAPAQLQEVSIPIWSNAGCKQRYGSAAPGGIVESFLCAGEDNKDSCSGDSGGPLMVNDGRWTQVGIVSWGIGCSRHQYPGVYTRVTHFLPWIYKNLK
ncbi:hypothetical protein QAD02_001738 [Eretmocerus hayati]|uniref:Uncharacterized protein n=1 Tax=Eretmocerus hayati TaxID=131215 RepID=A0ACC2NGV4_9HYME|nr:hypothetical protein QAD02_001738 [Eretmocerus hayati]